MITNNFTHPTFMYFYDTSGKYREAEFNDPDDYFTYIEANDYTIGEDYEAQYNRWLELKELMQQSSITQERLKEVKELVKAVI